MASRVLKGSIVVTASSLLTFALRFAKNIVLAHLLTKFDYGACVALIAVVTSAQLLTDFGFDKMLVQERSIAVEALQPVLTTLSAMRAAFAALLLLALSKPLALMFGAPNATGAFALLAVGVVLQGLSHLDPVRVQRLHQFVPLAARNLTISFVDFMVALTCAYMFRSFFAVAVAFVASAAAGLLASQLLARDRFSLRWNTTIIKRAWQFGSPLVLSGMIILGASQADRLIVGAALGLPVLAVYGAAMTILATPSAFVSSVAITVLLPTLSDAPDDATFAKRFKYARIVITFIAGFIYLPLMFLGKPVIILVFGHAYNPGLALIWVVVLGQAATLLRVWPNIGALALGDTKNLIVSNIPRAIGIVLALAAMHFGLGLMGIAASFACGELVALVSAILHLCRRQPQLLLGSFWLFVILYSGLLMAAETSYQIGNHVIVAFAASFAFNCVLGIVLFAVSAESRSLADALIRRTIGRRKHPRMLAQ